MPRDFFGLCFSLLLALLFYGSPPAGAAILQVNGAGKLVGAVGVNVNGTLYDVAFKDGTCASVFGSCELTKFDFRSSSDARAASNALLEQVFVNVSSGQFDSNPELTNGCEDLDSCLALTPYEFTSVSSDNLRNQAGSNYAGTSSDFVDQIIFVVSLDTSIYPKFTWADWSLHEQSVPEPGALPLLAAAMFGAAMITRRRRQLG